MRLTVATLHFGNLPYFKYSEAINSRYCSHHRYSFKIINAPRQIERAPVWFKVKGVYQLLQESDFVLFIDADAYFLDHSQKIETLISEEMGNASLLFGTDRLNKDFAFSDSDANSGVFVVRHSDMASRILQRWWDVPTKYDKAWLWKWPPEQGALNNVVRPMWDSSQIKVIPYVRLNGSDGLFIRHLIGFSNRERLKILRAENKRLLSKA